MDNREECRIVLYSEENGAMDSNRPQTEWLLEILKTTGLITVLEGEEKLTAARAADPDTIAAFTACGEEGLLSAFGFARDLKREHPGVDVIMLLNRSGQGAGTDSVRYGLIRKTQHARDAEEQIIKNSLKNTKSEIRLAYRSDKGENYLSPEDVIYVSVEKERGAVAETVSGRLRIGNTLAHWARVGLPFGFVRVHRSYLINIFYLKYEEKDRLILKKNLKGEEVGTVSIPYSRRSYGDMLRGALEQFCPEAGDE